MEHVEGLVVPQACSHDDAARYSIWIGQKASDYMRRTGGVFTITKLARRIGVPAKYLRQLAWALRKRGDVMCVLKSKRARWVHVDYAFLLIDETSSTATPATAASSA